MGFKQKYNLQERIEKHKKQMVSHPEKIVIIVEKHPKSKLPELTNPKFLCEKNYKFNAIKTMLANRIKQAVGAQGKSATDSFFIYINKNIPSQEQTMQKLYERHKDEDGFLYLQYGQMETYGN